MLRTSQAGRLYLLIQEQIKFCRRSPVQSKDCFHRELVQDQVLQVGHELVDWSAVHVLNKIF
jgi:hypothetical protein